MSDIILFSSTAFLFLFFPVVIVLYYLVPLRARNYYLILISLFFYFLGEGGYTVIIILSSLFIYLLGRMMAGKQHDKSKKKKILAAGIVTNLLLLIIYKYTNFFIGNLNAMLSLFQYQSLPMQRIHLPVGISFYTFHAIAYLVDFYRDETDECTGVSDVMLYISLFPKIATGPIVRYKDIAARFQQRFFDPDEFTYGLKRFIIGLGKKVLIANTVAIAADKIFSIPSFRLTTPLAWIGIICYTIQIYYDFSGYTDMAIGLGRMFGFSFIENFNYPYISRSIREFWRRWHISLSLWFRDYLYIPLGGNKTSHIKMYFNLVIVFFLCGLWHGASWNFAIWGLYHGLFLVIERIPLMERFKIKIAPLQFSYALLVVMIGWVFFKTDSPSYAASFIGAMFGFAGGPGTGQHVFNFVDWEIFLAIIAGIVGSAPLVPFLEKKADALVRSHSGVYHVFLGRLIQACGILLLVGVFLLCLIKVSADAYNPFIYSRF